MWPYISASEGLTFFLALEFSSKVLYVRVYISKLFSHIKICVILKFKI